MASEPGWHPNPQREGGYRWWDGQRWTGHTSPTKDAEPPTGEATYSPVGSEPSSSHLGKTAGLAAVAVIGLVLVVANVLSGGDGSDGGSPDRDESNIGTAKIMCRNFVEDRLKSPSTADFSDESPEEVGLQQWRVTGAVDSENSFGAMVRNDFDCTVKYEGDDNWRLVSLSGLSN